MELENNSEKEELILIKRILVNLEDENLIKENLGELEQRYGKATGMLAQVLFNSNFKNELEILNHIKEMDK